MSGEQAIANLDADRLVAWKNHLRLSDHHWQRSLADWKALVAAAGYRWTDLPYQNGNGVYTTKLPQEFLFRAIYLTRVLYRDYHLTLQDIQRLCNLQSGGQWVGFRGNPLLLDRFLSSQEVVERLLQIFNELKKSGSRATTENTREILVDEWASLRMDPDQEYDRFWLAYRWNNNTEGIIPKPTPILQDYPTTSLLDFARD